MLIYEQKAAILTFPDGTKFSGYAGRDAGKNNPDMQNVKGIGPLPIGKYYGTELHEDDPVVGKYAIVLTPDPSNQMFGRNSFFLHGDSIDHPGEASHGCIVMPKAARLKFWEGDDHTILVTA